jgi:hypothetical protein
MFIWTALKAIPFKEISPCFVRAGIVHPAASWPGESKK